MIGHDPKSGQVSMIERVRRFVSPGNAACVAALLIAVGVEAKEPLVQHILEILGAAIAVIGFFARGTGRAARL